MARAKKTITNEESYWLPFPKRLRELLDSPNETQEKLANAIGVKRQSISQWQNGITSPDINVLKKISDYFNVSADYLIGRIDVKSPEIDSMAIHKKTGLSDEALKEIAFFNSTPGFKHIMETINKFMSSIDFRPLMIELHNCQNEKIIIERKGEGYSNIIMDEIDPRTTKAFQLYLLQKIFTDLVMKILPDNPIKPFEETEYFKNLISKKESE